MSGGLIQIVTYGNQDLYLTGNPEITYFKTVYRRYTNFSVESVKLNFDDPVGFGRTSTIIIPKVGDLINNCYVEIILPMINLQRFKPKIPSNLLNNKRKGDKDYKIVTDFLAINRSAYVNAFDLYIAENNNDSQKIIKTINKIFDKPINTTIVNNFKKLMANNESYIYQEVSLQSIASNFVSSDCKEIIFSALLIGINKCINLQNYYFKKMKHAQEEYEEYVDTNLKFAWVDSIGHAIIDYIEIEIGGQKIDKQYGDWLNIWNQLSGKKSLEELYNKMIGRVDILTNFDRNEKPC